MGASLLFAICCLHKFRGKLDTRFFQHGCLQNVFTLADKFVSLEQLAKYVFSSEHDFVACSIISVSLLFKLLKSSSL